LLMTMKEVLLTINDVSNEKEVLLVNDIIDSIIMKK